MSSIPDTLKHIRRVQTLLAEVSANLTRRAIVHDASKLESPEVEAFDQYTPKLRASTYGSEEYYTTLAAMRPALEHHYAHNAHHPEHHAGGIEDMSLLDLIEMLCDWQAATERHADGCLERSIRQNAGRFGYSRELERRLLITARELGFLPTVEVKG